MKINLEIIYNPLIDCWQSEKYDLEFCDTAIQKLFPQTKNTEVAWLTVSNRKLKNSIPLVVQHDTWICDVFIVHLNEKCLKILGKPYEGKTFYVKCYLEKPRTKKHGIRNHQ